MSRKRTHKCAKCTIFWRKKREKNNIFFQLSGKIKPSNPKMTRCFWKITVSQLIILTRKSQNLHASTNFTTKTDKKHNKPKIHATGSAVTMSQYYQAQMFSFKNQFSFSPKWQKPKTCITGNRRKNNDVKYPKKLGRSKNSEKNTLISFTLRSECFATTSLRPDISRNISIFKLTSLYNYVSNNSSFAFHLYR